MKQGSIRKQFLLNKAILVKQGTLVLFNVTQHSFFFVLMPTQHQVMHQYQYFRLIDADLFFSNNLTQCLLKIDFTSSFV